MKRGGGKQDEVHQVKNNLFCGLVLFTRKCVCDALRFCWMSGFPFGEYVNDYIF